jgi:hypothetical protein
MRYAHNQKNIPKDVKMEIQSLCAGYYRRQRIAKQRTAVLTAPISEELTAFMTYNDKIDRALCFIEEGMREYILHDIANGIGYWSSMASPFITCNAYYDRKNRALGNLAKELNLIV